MEVGRYAGSTALGTTFRLHAWANKIPSRQLMKGDTYPTGGDAGVVGSAQLADLGGSGRSLNR